MEAVFDRFTNNALVALSKKHLFTEGTLSPVKIGKEANVFSAETDDGRKICIKIYRLETANFNQMLNYISTDARFIGFLSSKRKVVFAWVQREFKNLCVAEKVGIAAPRALKFYSNILLMEFVGDEFAAPMLKDAPPKNPKKFFDEIIKDLRKYYHKGYTHGDLSKFNVLNDKEKPVLIDFSHGTQNTNPRFMELLVRDVKNINYYFKDVGYSDKEVLEMIRKPL